MEWIDSHLWAIPLMPLLGVLVHIFLGGTLGKKLVGILACLLVFISFGLSLAVLLRLLGLPSENRHLLDNFLPWIRVGAFSADWAFRADTLSAVMLLVVTGVGFLIHVYSTGYMHDDPQYIRFFAYLNLFTFSMLVLVLASNVFLMFIGWEGVGLCSYLLIGFWFHDLNNATAGMKAFIVNRVGDWSFLCGVLLLFWSLGKYTGTYTVDFYEINRLAPELPAGIALAVCLLLFGGAAGKSAQLPLYVWLPDAMAGPTPVSALIHAATMVTAGVYMIARFSGLYLSAPDAMMVVATVGALTALFSATIALAQNDIKKVLAYSTVSQLGYMFLGVGVGAFSAGIFHLMTHAFFKGLLFLGAGSVIHGLHGEQDLRRMGALKSKMPWTWLTFMAAWLAIAGFPGLSGFFSKDEILWQAFSSEHGHWALWLVGFVAAGLTAFYMTRLVVMTFYGESRWPEHAHPHESPRNMTVPLAILAVLCVIGGWVGVPAILHGANRFEHWMEPAVTWASGHGGAEAAEHAAESGSHGLEALLMAASVGVALLGIGIGWWMYSRRRDIPETAAARWPNLYRWVLNKYYVDELYQRAVVDNLLWLTRLSGRFDLGVIDGAVNGSAWLTERVSAISGWIDNTFVDGAVNGVAEVTRAAGGRLRLIQTGRVQQYLTFAAAMVAIGVAGIILWPSIQPWLAELWSGTI